MNEEIDPARRSALLATARQALESYLAPGRHPLPREEEEMPEAAPVSLFVTLRRGGQLRGCMGLLEVRMSLPSAVERCAISSANDPRFPPLRREEMEEIRIEISVLGPRKEIRGPDDVVVGVHGLVIAKDDRRGLLLPQVAVEQRWDARRFVEEVCLKAFLPPSAWTEETTTLQVFPAEVFGEKSPAPGVPKQAT